MTGKSCVREPNVSPGYYKDEELTRQAFDEDGWFRTGDIGHMEEGKFLMVTDRKKEVFKLSNGKFIAPQVIENIMKESPLIDQMMVIGEHEKFASGLISPDFKFLNEWIKDQKLAAGDYRESISLAEVQSYFSSEIDQLNKKLSPPERISRFRLVEDEWTPASGELSPTLKLKRRYIHEKYKDLIDEIYLK